MKLNLTFEHCLLDERGQTGCSSHQLCLMGTAAGYQWQNGFDLTPSGKTELSRGQEIVGI